MNTFETILFTKHNHIASITLNRPRVLNALNVQMRDELYEVLHAIIDDSEVRVVIFSGMGERAFCSGADLSEFLTAPPPTAAREIRFYRDLWGLFIGVPQPLIAAVHGYVLGAGIELAMCCDIRIASEDAQFGLPEIGLGIIPAAGGTQTVPRVAGRGRALEMALTNRFIKAPEALTSHMVNKVVPKAMLLPTAEKIAYTIATHDPAVIRKAKQAIVRGLDLSLSQGLELEKRLSLQCTL